MSDVKVLKVNNVNYNLCDGTARSMIARINVYLGNDGKIHFVKANGTDVVVG